MSTKAAVHLRAQSVCTHMGCTPNWQEAERSSSVPATCSGFYKDGINFEGPAPRPLGATRSAWLMTVSSKSTRAARSKKRWYSGRTRRPMYRFRFWILDFRFQI